jgi:hypothetical protein
VPDGAGMFHRAIFIEDAALKYHVGYFACYSNFKSTKSLGIITSDVEFITIL